MISSYQTIFCETPFRLKKKTFEKCVYEFCVFKRTYLGIFPFVSKKGNWAWIVKNVWCFNYCSDSIENFCRSAVCRDEHPATNSLEHLKYFNSSTVFSKKITLETDNVEFSSLFFQWESYQIYRYDPLSNEYAMKTWQKRKKNSIDSVF